MNRLLAAVLLAAAALVVAGCQSAEGGGALPCPAPAYQVGGACVFTPATTDPCPAGWRLVRALCVDGADSLPVIFFALPSTPPQVGGKR